jgi:hypothetical protein
VYALLSMCTFCRCRDMHTDEDVVVHSIGDPMHNINLRLFYMSLTGAPRQHILYEANQVASKLLRLVSGELTLRQCILRGRFLDDNDIALCAVDTMASTPSVYLLSAYSTIYDLWPGTKN